VQFSLALLSRRSTDNFNSRSNYRKREVAVTSFYTVVIENCD
jgi:hypothetical protein